MRSDSFDIHYGGGEANVAVSLANYGDKAEFVTKLPANDLGQAAIDSLASWHVCTDHISRGGSRIGIYYLETGAAVRASKVIYDRAHSAISEANKEEFNWEEIFRDADWFHWTGITPALSDGVAAILEEALKEAKKLGLTVSCDLNYRRKLWTPEKAQSVMKTLMRYVDVCIGNEEDAQLCLGLTPDADVAAGKTDAEGYKGIFLKMKELYGFKFIATSLRESFSASHNGWEAALWDGEHFFNSRRYDIDHIVDRVGSGDAFAAGLIHALVNGWQPSKALEFAVAASALKHTIAGDFNQFSEIEVLSLANGNASGRVQR